MLEHVDVFKQLGLMVVGAPVGLFGFLGLASLLRTRPLTEVAIARCVQVAIVTGLTSAFAMLVLMLVWNDTQVPIEMGSWVHLTRHDTDVPHRESVSHGEPEMEAAEPPDAENRYHFVFKFEFDRLSIPFVILTYVLCGTIGAFANRYMHREPGFNRFFLLWSLFVVGMVTTSLAGTIETLFTGWELVGLSSALLVAFFQERPAPASNGLHVWIVYRISDAALLMASVALHHMKGEGDFDKFLVGEWPNGHTGLQSYQAMSVGLLLLLAAMGKSAMVPFSGWLPRAMEGPTPSSAVFYGALSVHLGAFLMLRFSPLIQESVILRILVITVGLVTAVYSKFAGEVQTDVKSALSFASLTQVGLIFVEIGLGLQYLALLHILGHGCLRSLQFLRAPTLLHDFRVMEDAIGDRLPRFTGAWIGRAPVNDRTWYFRLALERGYLDSYLKEMLVRPFLSFLRHCDSLEQNWMNWLSRTESTDVQSRDNDPSMEKHS
jgi:NAD(P)H-quinone oxidoreductase subunit 5